MGEHNYFMGTKLQQWRKGTLKTVTFVVTEDCNLACKYCYMTGKNTKHRMSFEVAKKAVDYILNNPEIFYEESVVWEFIGGEPLLEIGLIDQITDYIIQEMTRLNHNWLYNYKLSMSSNGVLYDRPEVQNYIKKNYKNLSIGITVDGTQRKHDLQRIKPNGEGSYEDVAKNVPLWKKQFPGSTTKVTFAHDDLPYLKESIISLYEMGITQIPANVIFEDDWQEGDDQIFENQLKELADYIIDNQLWNSFNTTLFSDTIGFALGESSLKSNWCGAGKMLAIDHQGKFYPCVRFLGFSLNNREGYVVGDIENGYDFDKLRPFWTLTLEKQSTEECQNCQVATGCAWCQGCNYDNGKIDTIYHRATYICKMHKARVRANDYYWTRLKREAGIQRTYQGVRKNHLYFLLADDAARYCHYDPTEQKGQRKVMNLETLKEGLELARKNFFVPVLLVPPEGLTEDQRALLETIEVYQVHEGTNVDERQEQIIVYEHGVDELHPAGFSILMIKSDQIPELSEMVKKLLTVHERVNLIIEDMDQLTRDDLATYQWELEIIGEYLAEELSKGNYRELNLLSDPINSEGMINCNSGVDSYTIAPNGQFYICPAFYYNDPEDSIGNLTDGITFDYQEYLTLEKSPVCSECDANHCKRCVYQNKKQTREYLIPGRSQCTLSHAEREAGKRYAQSLAERNLLTTLTERSVEEIFPEIDYDDPVVRILQLRDLRNGA